MERDPLYDVERKVERMESTLYGNGIEGLTSRMNGIEDRLNKIDVYLDGWKLVTTYDDYKSMKRTIEDLTRKVYMMGALLAVLIAALKIVPPDILEHIFK